MSHPDYSCPGCDPAKRSSYHLLGLAVALCLLSAGAALGQEVGARKPAPQIRRLPSQVFFEPTADQSGDGPLYVGRGNGYSVFLSKREVALVVPSSLDPKTKQPDHYQTVRLVFDGDSHANVVGIDDLEGKSNYFSGTNPEQWRRNVPHFGKVLYQNIYPGIDLIFYSRDGQLEFDYALSPGTNPDLIRFKTIGGETSISAAGDLLVRTGKRDLLTIKRPHAYQESGDRRAVLVHYTRDNRELALRVAPYDVSLPLTVDPALVFSTYITSNCAVSGFCGYTVNGVAADASGVYLTGYSEQTPFPSVANGPTAMPTNGPDIFLTKLDPTGSHILYSDLFAGTSYPLIGNSTAYVSVDSLGAAYLAGMATPGFPTTAGAFVTANPGGCGGYNKCVEPFAMKISPDGSTIQYSTFLQSPYPSGSSQPFTTTELAQVAAAAVDSSGALYIVGNVETISCFGGTFNDPPAGNLMPLAVTTGAVQTTRPSGCQDAFALKLNPSGSALEYATYLGGPNGQQATAVAVDSAGATYVGGDAGTGYPTTPGAYQSTFSTTNNGTSGFVTKLNASGTSFLYSTYWSGTPPGVYNVVGGIAVDSLGQAAIAAYNGGVGKLNASGTGVVYSNVLPTAQVQAVAVDNSGAAYITGITSAASSFPLSSAIQQYAFSTTYNQIVAKVDTSGNIDWATFFGGLFNNNNSAFFGEGTGIATDPTGDVYVLGKESFTPVTPGALEPSALLAPSSFLAKIAPSLGSPVPATFLTFIAFGNAVVGVPSSPQYVTIGNLGDAELPPPTISISGDFAQTNTCASPVPPGQNCFATVTFSPTTAGDRTGTLTISYGGAFPPQTVQLLGTGTAPQASLSSNSLVFPPQSLGTTSTLMQVTITNTGAAPLTTSSVSVTGDFAQTNTCGTPVQVNGICLVQVTFTPTAQGFRTGTLTINDNAPGSPQIVSLQGYGGAATTAALNPTSLTFSPQTVGITSPTQSVTVSNAGTTALAISSILASGDFAQSNNCGSSVGAGASCQISMTFTPTATGTRSGSVRIIDNTSEAPQAISLTGTGAGPNLGLGVPSGGSSSITLQAGASGSYTLTIGGAGIAGTASLSCTGAPAGVTCSVPSTVTLNANSPTSVAVSVTTTARSTVLIQPVNGRPGFPMIVAVLALSIIAAGMAFASTWSTCIRFACLIPVLWLCSCGGGNSSSSGGGTNSIGTAAGNYQLSVTATSGSATQSMNLTLTVQ